jgi:hypothetical protein
MSIKETKEIIMRTIDDMILDFLVYDRKNDEYLPRDVIEYMVKNGDLDIDEMVDRFKDSLIASI